MADASKWKESEEKLLHRLQKEVGVTKGLAPFNYYPMCTVYRVLAVSLVKEWSEDKTKFSESITVPQATDLPPDAQIHIAPLLWEGEGSGGASRRFFSTWTHLVQLRVNGQPCTMGSISQGVGDLWWWLPPVSLLGGTFTLSYFDARQAPPGRQLTKVKPTTAIVVVAASPPCTNDAILKRLKSVIPREKFLHQDDDDVTVEVEIRLRDPVLLTRIDTPVRGKQCGHPQCFDLNGFVGLVGLKQPNDGLGLKCLTCLEPLYIKDLVVDETFERFMKENQEEVNRKESFNINPAHYARDYNDGATGEGTRAKYQAGQCVAVTGGNEVGKVVRSTLHETHVVLCVEHAGIKGWYVETGVTTKFRNDAIEAMEGTWRREDALQQDFFVAAK